MDKKLQVERVSYAACKARGFKMAAELPKAREFRNELKVTGA